MKYYILVDTFCVKHCFQYLIHRFLTKKKKIFFFLFFLNVIFLKETEGGGVNKYSKISVIGLKYFDGEKKILFYGKYKMHYKLYGTQYT